MIPSVRSKWEGNVGSMDGGVNPSLWLLSGRLPWLQQWWDPAKMQSALLLCTSGGRAASKVLPRVKWYHWRHRDFGGASTCDVHVGFWGIDDVVVPPKSRVHRSVVKYLDPTQRGQSCPSPSGVEYWDPRGSAAVVAPTVFSATGWCSRELTEKEKLAILGLPADTMPTSLLSLTPPLLLQMAVDAGSHNWARPTITPSTAKIEAPAEISTPDGDFLSDIGLFLPATWADPTLISSKAVKADDAAVPTQMWDQRILSVLPINRKSKFGKNPILALSWIIHDSIYSLVPCAQSRD